MSETPDRKMWDDIVTAGWGPGYAGGQVLSLLRGIRLDDDAAPKRIIVSPEREAQARWYYRQLVEHAFWETTKGPWTRALAELWEWLTPEEHARLKQ